jgi:hypothetical protein
MANFTIHQYQMCGDAYHRTVLAKGIGILESKSSQYSEALKKKILTLCTVFKKIPIDPFNP